MPRITKPYTNIHTKLWKFFSINMKKREADLVKITLADFTRAVPFPPPGSMADRHTKTLHLEGAFLTGT